MEVLLVLTVLFFALGFLVEKVTAFLVQLKTNDSTKLKNGFEAKLTITPVNKKSEVCAQNTNSTNDRQK